MNIIIYYFTGTGNSLYAAKKIAAALEEQENSNCKVIPMVRINEGEIEKNIDCIGFVFPVYGGGLPFAVKNFINNNKFPVNKYYFAVSTYGGGVGNSISEIKNLLAKHDVVLNYGNGVYMFANYVALYKMADNSKEAAKKSDLKINEICSDIILKKQFTIPGSLFLGLINKSFLKNFPNKDMGYNTSENCSGCGICASVCPVKNIIIKDKKPEFLHKCEQCMACIQWCPEKALNYKNKTQTRGRYHHPEITLNDMLLQND